MRYILLERTLRSIMTVFFKDELKQELEDLQQDELNERLNQADHVPVHQPPIAKRVEGKFAVVNHHARVFIWFLTKFF